MSGLPRSLRTRLVLVGVILVLIAVAATAFTIQRITRSDIETAIERDLDAEINIRDALVLHSIERAGWDGIEATVRDLALIWNVRVAVATLDGNVLADSSVGDRGGDAAPLPSQALIVNPASTLIDFGFPTTQEQFEALREATTRSCYDDFEVAWVDVADGAGDIEAAPVDSPTQRTGSLINACVAERLASAGVVGDFPDERLATEIPPLQLFLGVGDPAPGLLTTGRSGSFWVAVAGIVVAASLIAALLADRITCPLHSLATASRRMSNGDLATRVDVSGSSELSQLGEAFNEMARSLGEQDQARRTLTSDVSHELRSPLSNLRGYIEAIQDGVVQPDSHTISLLHDQATQMQMLVDDLQELSLAQVGQLQLRFETVDVSSLVESVAASHRAQALAADVEIEVKMAANATVQGDPARLHQVVTNLLSNAIRHAGPDRLVRLGVSLVDDLVVVSVADRGAGITCEHLPHIFDRFYRADPSRTRSTGGTGLGLAIAQKLVHAHGGAIDVHSTVNDGSTFSIRLPFSAEPGRNQSGKRD